MPEKVYSVGALTRSIRKNLLANNERIAGVWIEGEVSGCKTYSSGHVYFTLKDKDAQISCVLFAFRRAGCDEGFRVALARGDEAVNGLKVQVSGELDLNMSRGQYSFKVSRLRLAGLGDRMAQYNALKARLDEEGLNKLDHPELRRPIPYLPHRIGIVTSPSGAVIHDMCTVLTRRFPNLEIRLYPVKVQGPGAKEEIVEGIRHFNCMLDGWSPDLLIVGRGGGSMEDLWAFNEECVVRAVAESAIPVVSAVGHETDYTLCDFAADVRAGTPSIAAEMAVPVKSELVQMLRDLAGRLRRAPEHAGETFAQRLDHLTLRLSSALRDSASRTEARLAGVGQRIVPAIKDAVAGAERRLDKAGMRLLPAVEGAFAHSERRLVAVRAKLALLDPASPLKRGYSLTFDASGHVVRSAEALNPDDVITTRLCEGEISSTVCRLIP